MAEDVGFARVGFWPRLLKGVLIGMAFLLPGTSGGALAATLGVFEPAIAALSGLRRRFRPGLRYLLPLAVGGCIGALLVAVVLVDLLGRAETQAISFFLGMVAGSLPTLWRAGQRDRPHKRQWLLMAAGLAVTLGLQVLEVVTGVQPMRGINPLSALASGAILGAGAVVPGISGSFFVVYLGWYRPLMEQLLALNMPIVLLTVAGFVLAIALLVKLAHRLFTHHRRDTYSVIFGFVLGSLALVLPDGFFGASLWLNLFLTALGAACGLMLGRFESNETKGAGPI